MPLINTSVPNLIQGVSQQADASRFAGQCEEQENALSSVAEGLKKRPNTRHVGRLMTTAIDEDSFVHFIDRDDSEKYCITQDENTIRVHNALTGVQCSVTEQDTSDFTISNDEVDTTGTYLDTANARKNIKPLTIGDTTFLLNTEKVAALDTSKETPDLSSEALVFIKQGDYSKKYGFKIQGRNRVGSGELARVTISSEYFFYPTVGNVLRLAARPVSNAYPNWILDGGTGFAENDIVNITLVGSGSVDIYDSAGGSDGEEQGERIDTVTHYLTQYEQPTMKVLTVDSDGAILTAEVVNRGAFRYGQLSTDSNDYDVSSNFWTSPSVFSSNNTETDATGDNAVIEVLQATNYSWSGYGTYSATNASNYVSQVRILDGGSGFAEGDVLDLAEDQFPPNRQWTNQIAAFFAPPDYGSTLDLNYVETPQVRVTAVDLEGAIESLVVEDGGRFGYGDNAGVGYNTTGSNNNNSTYASNNDGYYGNFSIVSTNNTPVDVQADDSFSGERIITSSAAAGSDSSVIDSSVILNQLRAGSDVSINVNFDTDYSNIDSNLLIISPKKLPSGQNTTQYFQVTPVDGLAGSGIGIVHREVSSMVDLPLVAPHGHKVKVVGDTELGQDDFYCEFNLSIDEAEEGEVGQGTWVECAGARVSNTIDETTMPRLLVNVAENVFQVRRMSFGKLIAGDENSNPPPSFIGNTINNMFQFKSRLGFLCQDSVILSESGFGGFDSALNRQSFNFFRTTVTSLLDTGPIDVTVASNRVTNLKAAQGFQENLVLFSAHGQFVLKGGDILTPKTVSVNPITNFSFEDKVEPLPLGSYIYFPFTRGAFSGMREFTVNASTDNYDSTEVTEHVPAYIPQNIIDMAGSSSEDIIALLSSDEKNALYIYTYFWSNNQKVLSAWSKFTFTGEIRGIEFIESTLYMVMTDDEGNTHLVSLPLEAGLKDLDHTDTSANFLTLLDRRVRVKVASGSRQIQFEKADGTYGLTQADIPYTYYNGGVAGYILPEVLVDSTATTHALTFANIQGNGGAPILSVAATTDLYGYVGLPYTMNYKFSTQVFKASSGKSASPTNASAMQIRSGTMFFDDTHTFDVKVTPENRTTATNTFLADDVPEATLLGAVKFAEGSFKFPVYSKAKHASILIQNSSPFDCKFSSAEFESFVHPRSQRYG